MPSADGFTGSEGMAEQQWRVTQMSYRVPKGREASLPVID